MDVRAEAKLLNYPIWHLASLRKEKKRQRRVWMRLEVVWKTKRVQLDSLLLSLKLEQPIRSQMLPVKCLTGAAKNLSRRLVVFDIKVFRLVPEWYSLLEAVHFDKLLAGFPRAAPSLFALAVVVFASSCSSWEPHFCFECHKLRDGIVPRAFGGPWDLVLMLCCCSALFNFDCGLSWLVTAAPPGGRPDA